jgi:hypothetical protein
MCHDNGSWGLLYQCPARWRRPDWMLVALSALSMVIGDLRIPLSSFGSRLMLLSNPPFSNRRCFCGLGNALFIFRYPE